MAKYYGRVGYVVTVEESPGDWVPKPIEVPYSGDTISNTSRWVGSATKVNDDIDITNRISILADPFAIQNFQHIKYAEFMGTFWEVNSVTVEYPRLILTLGGVYNGERANIAE